MNLPVSNVKRVHTRTVLNHEHTATVTIYVFVILTGSLCIQGVLEFCVQTWKEGREHREDP